MYVRPGPSLQLALSCALNGTFLCCIAESQDKAWDMCVVDPLLTNNFVVSNEEGKPEKARKAF